MSEVDVGLVELVYDEELAECSSSAIEFSLSALRLVLRSLDPFPEALMFCGREPFLAAPLQEELRSVVTSSSPTFERVSSCALAARCDIVGTRTDCCFLSRVFSAKRKKKFPTKNSEERLDDEKERKDPEATTRTRASCV